MLGPNWGSQGAREFGISPWGRSLGANSAPRPRPSAPRLTGADKVISRVRPQWRQGESGSRRWAAGRETVGWKLSKNRDTSDWLNVPGMYEHHDVLRIRAALEPSNIDFRVEAITLSVGSSGGRHAHRARFKSEDGPAAARVFQRLFEIEDPSQVSAFTGACPACGLHAQAAWECPSCELGFGPVDEDSEPRIAFIRDHGGF